MRYGLTLLLLGALTGAFAQRPRTVDPAPITVDSAPSPAARTVEAKYEGGVFGFRKTMDGTLTLDDENKRLLFKDKKTPKEFPIPFEAITSAFADTQKRQPKAAAVASSVPLIYAWPARFITTKVRYLTLEFSDPDSRVRGITSFKFKNKEVLESYLEALAQKAGMTKLGDIYVK